MQGRYREEGKITRKASEWRKRERDRWRRGQEV